MVSLGQAIAALPWSVLAVLCLTLGLAPFAPPHIVEKVQMLVQGRLVRPIDWFDLVLHGAPWALLLAKVVLVLVRRSAAR
ncbi:MAG TPA: hypothetical protein VEJ89_12590 [Myxococcaceae bacterium]|nr:hypothetical protein [Myxococcaceae bacterium]